MKNYYKSGDIVLINFPFTDFTSRKVRPALVVCNQVDKDLLLAPISTLQGERQFIYIIDDKVYSQGTLNVKSCIRYSKLINIEGALVLKKVAELKDDILVKVKKHIIDYIKQN